MKIIVFSSILLVATFLNLRDCESYRILGLFPLETKSHFIMFEALMKGLARKGHQVDVVSPFGQKESYPNYTDIIELPLTMPPLTNNLSYGFFTSSSHNVVQFIVADIGNRVCENLGHPKMLELIRNPSSDPPYDLIITEFFNINCFMAVGHHLKIPTIGVSSTYLYPWLNSIVANPYNAAFVPNNFLDYVAPMNFWQRFYNTFYSVFNDLNFRYLTRVQDDIIRKYMGDDAPGVREVERNVALVLMNSHVSVSGARPITSAVIEVGGLHIEDNDAKLSEDLKEWMNTSQEGFVYFTFGSMVTIESFPEETIRVWYKSLRKIAPIRVLMKIPNPKKLPPGMPKNIRTFDWAPQYNVLKHKNVKAFITHGGLMGTQEAIHCAVPMIGIPLFIDQFLNIDLYVKRNMAVKLDYQNITEKNMDHALNEILHNPVYRNAIMKISKKFRDRPMNPMDTATWWVEYVARRGSKILRSPAMDLTWWQIELLDVYVFLLMVVTIVMYLAVVLVRFLVKVYVTMIVQKATSTKKLE